MMRRSFVLPVLIAILLSAEGLGAQTVSGITAVPLGCGMSTWTPTLASREAADEQKKGLDLGPIGTWQTNDILPFLGGGLLGLVLHESGHLGAGYAVNGHPRIVGVHDGGVSFFAVSYDPLPARKRYEVSAAGFWVQFGSAEVVLKQHPHLWQDDAPVAKGVFAFHIVTSLVYAYGALVKAGPQERDTLNMAQALGIHEKYVGMAVLSTALLDLYRSFYPEARWATYTSRSLKVGFVFALTKTK